MVQLLVRTTRSLSLTQAGEQLYRTTQGSFQAMDAGLAYVPEELVTDELERGTLIRVLQRFSHRLDGLFLYYPHRNVSPALRAVIDTLKL